VRAPWLFGLRHDNSVVVSTKIEYCFISNQAELRSDSCQYIFSNSIALTVGNITITSTHSLRSLGKFYGRISLRSKAAPIKFPVMWGVIRLGGIHALHSGFSVSFGNQWQSLCR
jgi:hypothetical protein